MWLPLELWTTWGLCGGMTQQEGRRIHLTCHHPHPLTFDNSAMKRDWTYWTLNLHCKLLRSKFSRALKFRASFTLKTETRQSWWLDSSGTLMFLPKAAISPGFDFVWFYHAIERRWALVFRRDWIITVICTSIIISDFLWEYDGCYGPATQENVCTNIGTQIQSQGSIHFRGNSLIPSVYLWTSGQKHLYWLISKIVSLGDIHSLIHSRFPGPLCCKHQARPWDHEGK